MKFWLYSLCCTIHPCSFFILYLPLHHPPSTSPPHFLLPKVNTGLFSISVSISFSNENSLICVMFQIPHVSDKIQYLPFSIRHFIKCNILQVHSQYCKWKNFILFYCWVMSYIYRYSKWKNFILFLWLSNIIYIYSLSIYLLIEL